MAYVSLLPFDFESKSLEQVILEFSAHSKFYVSFSGLREILCNYVLYLPIGFILFFSRRSFKGDLRIYIVGTLTALMVSGTIESLQGIVAGRYASFLDILVNCAGAIAGVGLAEMISSRVTALSAFLHSKLIVLSKILPRSDRLSVPFATSIICLLLYLFFLYFALSPFAGPVAISMDKLEGFFRLPFSDFQQVDYFRGMSNGLVKLILFFPLGLLLALSVKLYQPSSRLRRRFWLRIVPFVCLSAVAIELLQLASVEKTASLSDSCFYLIGISAGSLFFSALRLERVRFKRISRKIAVA